MAFQTKALHIYYVMKSHWFGGRSKEENEKYFLYKDYSSLNFVRNVQVISSCAFCVILYT